MAKNQRFPNLNTILMVEKFLKENCDDIPMKISVIRANIPKQVMYPTLKTILEYLHESGKIIYGPKGIQWIYSSPKHLKKMMNDSMEI